MQARQGSFIFLRRKPIVASLIPLLCLLFGCGGGDLVSTSAGNFSISGTISSGPQVAVALSGAASATTTTDNSGNYSFGNLSAGSYVVSPAPSACFGLSGAQQQSVTIGGASASGIDFSGSEPGLKFCDDFTATPLSLSWFAVNERGDPSNNELQCYTPAQDSIGNSDLVITPIAQNTACGTSGAQMAYASGEVVWSSLSFTYGTVEFRARMPGGSGTWPAIWLLGKNCQPANANGSTGSACKWPQPGSDEIDIIRCTMTVARPRRPIRVRPTICTT
jgi:hypothetical protein